MKDLSLYQIVEIRQNFEKVIEDKLLKMVCYFQTQMWDGYSDENDPKFITQEDFDGIEALSGKLSHMLINIGSGISFTTMIESICERKIKHWQATDNVETSNKQKYFFNEETKRGVTTERMGFRKGKQLKNNDELRRVYSTDGDYHINPQERVISGHFRWNNRGYILSRRVTDLLSTYNF